MKTKVTLDAESINRHLSKHNVDYSVYNGNYVYINYVNDERQIWLEPLVDMYRLHHYDIIRVWYNAYSKDVFIRGERDSSASQNKVFIGHITYKPLVDFIEDLKLVKVSTEYFD